MKAMIRGGILGLGVLIEANLFFIYLMYKDTRERHDKEKVRRLQGGTHEKYFPTRTWYQLMLTMISGMLVVWGSIMGKVTVAFVIMFGGFEMVYWISDWENTVRQTMVFSQVNYNMKKKNPFGRVVMILCSILRIALYVL
ncbi:hypothetical protein RFI_01617, partial [Reticulomyxa filosa]